MQAGRALQADYFTHTPYPVHVDYMPTYPCTHDQDPGTGAGAVAAGGSKPGSRVDASVSAVKTSHSTSGAASKSSSVSHAAANRISGAQRMHSINTAGAPVCSSSGGSASKRTKY